MKTVINIELEPDEIRRVEALAQRDRRARKHEIAHLLMERVTQVEKWIEKEEAEKEPV